MKDGAGRATIPSRAVPELGHKTGLGSAREGVLFPL